MEKYDTDRQAINENIPRSMRFADWIPKATDTEPEYVIRFALPWQQTLREHGSILRLNLHCLTCQFQ